MKSAFKKKDRQSDTGTPIKYTPNNLPAGAFDPRLRNLVNNMIGEQVLPSGVADTTAQEAAVGAFAPPGPAPVVAVTPAEAGLSPLKIAGIIVGVVGIIVTVIAIARR